MNTTERPGIRSTISSTLGIAIGTAGCYAAGSIYGAVCRIDRTIAARAFAIAIAAKLAFTMIANLVFGTDKKDAKKLCATILAGNALFFAVTIPVFRQLNLIGPLGTSFMAFGGLCVILDDLYNLRKAW